MTRTSHGNSTAGVSLNLDLIPHFPVPVIAAGNVEIPVESGEDIIKDSGVTSDRVNQGE